MSLMKYCLTCFPQVQKFRQLKYKIYSPCFSDKEIKILLSVWNHLVLGHLHCKHFTKKNRNHSLRKCNSSLHQNICTVLTQIQFLLISVTLFQSIAITWLPLDIKKQCVKLKINITYVDQKRNGRTILHFRHAVWYFGPTRSLCQAI